MFGTSKCAFSSRACFQLCLACCRDVTIKNNRFGLAFNHHVIKHSMPYPIPLVHVPVHVPIGTKTETDRLTRHTDREHEHPLESRSLPCHVMSPTHQPTAPHRPTPTSLARAGGLSSPYACAPPAELGRSEECSPRSAVRERSSSSSACVCDPLPAQARSPARIGGAWYWLRGM